jgi:nucleotide-binding universal stress UspA family protein
MRDGRPAKEIVVLLRPSILCPVDLSDASRGALRHAAAIAEHFYAALTVLMVDEMPLLLPSPGPGPGEAWPAPLGHADLAGFVHDTFAGRTLAVPNLELVTAAGKPSAIILRHALDHAPDLIVMSTHGVSGVRKALFGSTTERVLRETSVPVLVTPANDPGPDSVEALKDDLRTVLVPVDLSAATPRQVQIARGLAEAFDAKVILVHAVEPPRLLARHETVRPQVREALFTRAESAIADLLAGIPARLHPEVVVRSGHAAETIADVADERDAEMIVMALHSDPANHARMGSVTHRVLCRVPRLVLALPPAGAAPRLTRPSPASARSAAAVSA